MMDNSSGRNSFNTNNMTWIHCNMCFSQPMPINDDSKVFYLTSCGHIFCENCGCFADNTSNSCRECKNECSYTALGDKTNSQVLEYFQDPTNTCEKLLQVMKFQRAHRNRLVGHHQRILAKYNRAKLYIRKLENELKMAKNAFQTNIHSNLNSTNESNPIFLLHSTPFKLINAEAKRRESTSPKLTFKLTDAKYRSNQSNVSEVSSAKTDTAIPTPRSSSAYESAFKDCSSKQFPLVSNLNLSSTSSK
ncbi:probable E3 SUMO-protein ligase RNF212 [Adelges cooleyi]|uniref:probable E3 SUMO-protein ligase RNF212 n=1 Tax=Adelges cooleyi TaxID=133065 RepID=UPI0021805453|nr:probable E3 SUMO-protein ligase RNF212 [Adelges cooleyi]